jgi:two-component system, chemotaxis family, sensor kinase CheA
MGNMEFDLEKIVRIFAAESDDHLAAMEQALLGLEIDPSDDKLLETIFRGAHTIKGNADSLGYSELARFAHGFEDLLQRLRSRQIPITRASVTLLLRAVDATRHLVSAAIAGVGELTPAHSGLLAELANGAPAASDNTPLLSPSAGERGVTPQKHVRAETRAPSERTATVRVEASILDRMLDLAGEIAIAQSRLKDALEALASTGQEAREDHALVHLLTFRMQEEIMKLRMQPIGPIFRRYLRAVRDLARAHGKLARVEIQGEEIELDVSVVEHLKDPLMHMIRNAIDHGLESPEKRQALGKDPCGLLTLKARHEDNQIVIQVMDDGAGLDRSRIIEAARRMGTGFAAAAATLGDAELFRIIFTPGFSTADKVTELSGRGVGMDVVRQNVEALGGSVAIESRPGIGTTITVRLPLTTAIIEGLSVGVGADTYLLPLRNVIECVPMPARAIRARPGQGVIDLRGEPLPFVRLRDWFQLPNRDPIRQHIVVVEANQTRAGLAVDALYGPRQIVVKPLAKQLQSLPGISGAAILGNGRVALILDPAELLRAVIGSPAEALPRSDRTAAEQNLFASPAAQTF